MEHITQSLINTLEDNIKLMIKSYNRTSDNDYLKASFVFYNTYLALFNFNKSNDLNYKFIDILNFKTYYFRKLYK